MERVRQRDHDDLQLPDDLLADVLRRLPPRCLAASRCVREAWRRVIDERRLLRSDLLPLRLAGIFIQLEGHGNPEFFSRPSSLAACATVVNTKLDFLPPTVYPFGGGEFSDPDDALDNEDYHIRDHCNGLLLTFRYVVNPATRRWTVLSTPQRPLADIARMVWYYNDYLSFDPTVSPHYQVFSIPCLLSLERLPAEDLDPLVEESEWPPSTWILNVFSSRSGRWEERSFIRQGDNAGSIAEARPYYGWPKCGAAFWRQALYVHCQTNFLVRIALSDDKYHVIKPPIDMDTRTHIGRSKHGVYYASLGKDVFRVWILDESYGQIKWALKGEYDLKHVQAPDQHVRGAWILQDTNHELFLRDVNKREAAGEKIGWNSDNDDVDDHQELVGECPRGFDILGFHPYKEIIFLSSFEKEWIATVHAYHLNTSRVECLGTMRLEHYDLFEGNPPGEQQEYQYFPYTPCWIDEFPSTQT